MGTKNTFIHIENDAPATRRRRTSAPPRSAGSGHCHAADESAGYGAPGLVTTAPVQPALFDIYSDDEEANSASDIDFGRIDLSFARLHSALEDADAYNVNATTDSSNDLANGQYIIADVNFSYDLALIRRRIANTLDNYAYESNAILDDLEEDGLD